MEKFCTNCGNTLEDNALFCPECGQRVEEAATSPEEAAATLETAAAVPEAAGAEAPQWDKTEIKPAYTVSQPLPPVTDRPEAAIPAETLNVTNKPLSTATYFWTLLLFSIPVIGLIVMLIMAFTAKNANRRNLAHACLIGLLICLILIGLFMLVLVVSGKSFGFDISKFNLETIWDGFIRGIGFTK